MKKIALAAVALLSMVSLQSCINDEVGNHGTMIYNRNNSSYTELYADQTVDSLHIVSYDSWTASIKYADTKDEWFTISDYKCNVPVDYIVTQSVIVNAQPNTTGKTRVAAIVVKSSYPEYGDLSTLVYQYAWHNITVPVPSFEKQPDDSYAPKFEAELAASNNTALMACAVFAEATLTSDADWLSIQNEDKVLSVGSHGLTFVVSPNTTAEERTAHVTLTSNGVSTVVTYKQKAKK